MSPGSRQPSRSAKPLNDVPFRKAQSKRSFPTAESQRFLSTGATPDEPRLGGPGTMGVGSAVSLDRLR